MNAPDQESAWSKSDFQKSQWLMKLHTYRLLRNSFWPPQEIRTLRTCWRQRNDLVPDRGAHYDLEDMVFAEARGHPYPRHFVNFAIENLENHGPIMVHESLR